jgi:1-acyl-sn-glycerol-3-phosphate acyltransferase
MPYSMRLILSALFVGQVYAAMLIVALIVLPWAVVDRRGALAAVRMWCTWTRFSARWMIGLRTEVRGPVPEGEVLIAAKHQSFLDIILLGSVLPQPCFVMKQELRRVPVLGWFALRIGCIPVDRSRGAKAIQDMVKHVAQHRDEAGQIVIYPQGTRVAPGAHMPYKIGTGVLYNALGQACVPVAVNVGLFWPRKGVMRKPGLAVIEFLPEIPPGLPMRAFMARVEAEIEAASTALMAEAGFRLPPPASKGPVS